jgi:hypothetical protein
MPPEICKSYRCGRRAQQPELRLPRTCHGSQNDAILELLTTDGELREEFEVACGHVFDVSNRYKERDFVVLSRSMKIDEASRKIWPVSFSHIKKKFARQAAASELRKF